MKDRSVEFPNRYRLTKVPGTDDIYDVEPAPGEVYEEGSDVNKANMLTDEVAELLCLGEDGQVNDALKILGNIGNVHIWKKTVEETFSSPGFRLDVPETLVLSSTGYSGVGVTWRYADSISVDEDGNVTLVDYDTVNVTYDTYTGGNVMRGKYVRKNNNESAETYYILPDANITRTRSSSGYTYSVYIEKVRKVIPHTTGFSRTVEILTSPDRNTYPDDGDLNGAHYDYKGVVGERARAQLVSYIGTGLNGEEEYCSVTFDYAFDFVWAFGRIANAEHPAGIMPSPVSSTNLPSYITIIDIRNCPEEFTEGYGFYMGSGTSYVGNYGRKTNSGKTFSWYSTALSNQINVKGYIYLILGFSLN